MSNSKEVAVRSAKINAITISAYVSMAYESYREVLEATCILHGYKVVSHVCLGLLLKHHVPHFSWKQFEYFRRLRNGINYYGKQVDFAEGTVAIQKLFLAKKRLLEDHFPEHI